MAEIGVYRMMVALAVAQHKPFNSQQNKGEENECAAASGRHTLVESGREQQRVAALEQKLQRRNEILAELMDEHFALKTARGSP